MSGIRIAVAGANGRMGQALVHAIGQSGDLTLSGIVGRGGDAKGVLARTDVLIEFTAPGAVAELASAAARARVAFVSGTTGLSREEEAAIREAAKAVPVLRSENMSVGITLLARLAGQAARALPGFDIEIVEMHHRAKQDAPSGTALALGRAAAGGRGQTPGEPKMRGPGSGARKDGEIGFASLRGGTVAGEHEVIFAGAHERIVLKHIAEDRSIFAGGALAAARWIAGQKPGLYTMKDVLGL